MDFGTMVESFAETHSHLKIAASCSRRFGSDPGVFVVQQSEDHSDRD